MKMSSSFSPRRPLLRTAALALTTIAGLVALPHRSPAPLVIRPGEGVTYTAPGQEEVPNARDAQAQFDNALAAENKGDLSSAVGGYRKTVRRFPKATVAASAQFRLGQVQEKQGDLLGAYKTYDKLARDYPRSADLDKALEGEFRIGTAYLEGKRQKVLGVPTLPSMNTAVTIFTSIVKTAPFSRYAPQAQFNIGMARERNGELNDAVKAYQTVVDKYPTDPAAGDALYQIGFVWQAISKSGSYDRVASVHAKESFEDFLSAYPNSERAAQARENLAGLGNQQTGGAFRIAKYYDKQKQYRAAIIYYNDVIRQNPNSKESEQSKARLAALRAKFGDATVDKALNPATPTAPGAAPASGDSRLQAQTDTSKRPDYNGPPVSAPLPPPGTVAGPGALPGRGAGGAPYRGGGPGAPPLSLPPPIPEGEQPGLPAPDPNAPSTSLPFSPAPGAPPADMNSPATVPSEPAAAPQPSPAATP